MRNVLLVPAALGTLFWVTAALADTSADEAAIMKIERDMAAAQNADTVTATWDDDAVWYDIAPGEVDGRAAIRDNIAGQFAKFRNFRQTILRIRVRAGDKVGFAFSTQHFVSDRADGGPKMDVVFRETDCFEKKDGKWRLVHQQLSFPVDASGKAVFDSK